MMMKPAKITICLWYDGDAEEAARFYASTFSDSSVGAARQEPFGQSPVGSGQEINSRMIRPDAHSNASNPIVFRIFGRMSTRRNIDDIK